MQRRFAHIALEAILNFVKSLIYSPPCFLFAIIVDFFILAGLLFHKKLKVIKLTLYSKSVGLGSTEHINVSLESARDFII